MEFHPSVRVFTLPALIDFVGDNTNKGLKINNVKPSHLPP